MSIAAAASFNRCGRFNAPRLMSSSDDFQICKLGKRHLASVALGLGIISLLLVIFAYHGGYQVGSWFYSLLVVISGLAFVVFGPLLLCRFLMHAYYRQLDAQAPNLRADAGTGLSGRPPHVYACIIIAPDRENAADALPSRFGDLPTYEEAVAAHDRFSSDVSRKANVTGSMPTSGSTSMPANCRQANVQENLNHCKQTVAKTMRQLVKPEKTRDSPPPSYGEALERMTTTDSSSIHQATSSSVVYLPISEASSLVAESFAKVEKRQPLNTETQKDKTRRSSCNDRVVGLTFADDAISGAVASRIRRSESDNTGSPRLQSAHTIGLESQMNGELKMSMV